MKKFLKVAAAAALCVSLTGCGAVDSFVTGFTEAAKEDLGMSEPTPDAAAPSEDAQPTSSETSTSATATSTKSSTSKTTTPKSSTRSSTSTSEPRDSQATKSRGAGTYSVKVDGETFVRDGFDVVCVTQGEDFGVGVNSKGIEYYDRAGSYFGAVLKNGELDMLAMQQGTLRGSNELNPSKVKMTKSGNTYTFSGEADFQDSRKKERPVAKKIEATVTCP
ncbi:lipoprotein LpqH [Corynebacterium sp. H128]|uniref:lipoprotein LpqH n=1 Tax=unclassified Corynebacterium TaxID=2624378 RepID=UPI00309EA880